MFKSYPKKKQLNLGDKVKSIVITKRKRTPQDQMTYRQLVKKADELWVKCVKKQAVKNGFISCFTCQKVYTYSEKGNSNIDAGHWISRSIHFLRWNLNNGRPQDAFCNRFRQGEPIKFEANLILEIGPEEVEKMKQIALNPPIVTREFVLEKIQELKSYLKS